MRLLALCFLLFLSLGWCVEGLQSDLEYQYRYRSSVETHTSATTSADVKEGVAAGIRADLTVQVIEEGAVIFKLSNVEVGNFHGELGCDPLAPLDIQFAPLLEEGLSQPFTFHFNQTLGGYLDTPVELEWVTNLRKSVVSVFNIPVLRGESTYASSFHTREDTLAGSCGTWNTMAKLPTYQATLERHKQEAVIEVDIQGETSTTPERYTAKTAGQKQSPSKTRGRGAKTAGSKTSPGRQVLLGPQIKPDYWIFSRDVKFSDCVGGFSWKNNVGVETAERVKQSSVGRYVLRGDHGAWRLEEAVVEGFVNVFSVESDSDFLVTNTRQSLQLVGVRQIQTELTPSYAPRRHYSLKFRPQYSPYSDHQGDGYGPSLEEALTGVPPTQQYKIDTQAMIVASIQYTSKEVTRGVTSNFSLSEYVARAVDRMSYLTKTEIDTIRTKLSLEGHEGDEDWYETSLSLLYTFALSTGTQAGIEFALEFAQENRELFLLLSELPRVIKNPSLLPRIIEEILPLVVGQPSVDDYDKSIVLLSVTHLVNKVCFNPERKSISTPTGSSCDARQVCESSAVTSLVPTLTQAIQSTENPEWIRLMNLKALCNLGTPSIIPVIKDIAFGLNQPTIYMRLNALACLMAEGLPWTARIPVYNEILMPLFSNVGELPEVRSLAFLVMTSWSPGQPWWNKMALSTWHDPSVQVANFISTAFTSLAQISGPLAERAASALFMVKPAKLTGTKSALIFLHEFVHNCQTKPNARFAWLTSTQDVFPSLVIFHLYTSGSFGLEEPFKVSFYQLGLKNLLNLWAKVNPRGNLEEMQLVLDMLQELKADLEVEPTEKRVQDLTLWVKLGSDILARFSSADGIIPEWEENHFLLSGRIHESTMVLPTDVGFPLVIKYTIDSTSFIRLEIPDTWRSFGVHHSSSFHYNMRTLVPWNSRSVVESGLHSTKSFIVQLAAEISYDLPQRTFLLTCTPFSQDKINLIKMYNTPYTSLGPLYLDADAAHIRPIHGQDFTEESHVVVLPAGLSLHSYWRADSSFPHTITRQLLLMDPLYTSYYFLLELDPRNLPCQEIRIGIPEVMESESQTINVGPESEEDFGQVSQGTADYDYMSQVSQSASADLQGFGQDQSAGFHQVEYPPHYFSMQNQVMIINGGKVQTAALWVEFVGATSCSKYEAALTWTNSHDRSTTRVLIAFTSFPPVQELRDLSTTCLDVTVQRPVFPPTTLDLVPGHLHKTYSLQVQRGSSCTSDPPILRLQADLDVSQESIDHTLNQLREADCHASIDLRPIHAYLSPVYDRVNFNATWTEAFPDSLANIVRISWNSLSAWLDAHRFHGHTGIHAHDSIIVNATKFLETDAWMVEVTTPNEVVMTEPFHVASVFSHLMMVPVPITTSIIRNYFHDSMNSPCVIDGTTSQVRTHDGKVYEFEPTECWSTAIIHNPGWEYEDASEVLATEFSIQVRYTDQWEARVMSPHSGSIIDFNRAQVKLNEEELTEPQPGRLQYLVDGDRMVVIVAGSVRVEVSDKVTLWSDEGQSGNIRGLCGNYDQEPENDLTGPKGCLYTDTELFASAWATSGVGCNRFRLNRVKSKVSEYQEDCPRHYFQPTGLTQPNVTESCLDWEYRQLNERLGLGQSLVGIPVCKPGCIPAYTIFDQLIDFEFQTTQGDQTECQTAAFPSTFPGQCRPSASP